MSDASKGFFIMLKSVFLKLVISVISITFFSPLFKPYSAQAFSFSPLIKFDFYQSGFPNNGFLKGRFYGRDIDNNGGIGVHDALLNVENSDVGIISLEYFSGNEEETFLFNTWDDVLNEFSYHYSISSQKLIGHHMTLRTGILSIDYLRDYKGMTCFMGYDIECSTSPIVIQHISDNNNPGGDSSTTVPEPSIIAGFVTFSLALLLKKKK